MYIIFPGIIMGIIAICSFKDKNNPTENEFNIIRNVFYPVIFIGSTIPPLGRFYESQISLIVRHEL